MGLSEGTFCWREFLVCRLIRIRCLWMLYVSIDMICNNCLKYLGKETEIGNWVVIWVVIFHVILVECRVFQKRRNMSRLEVWGDGAFKDNRLTTVAISVTRTSLQLFAKLVGIRSKSHDLHRAVKTRWNTSSLVAEVRLCKTSLVSEGFVKLEHEPEESEEWLIEILFRNKELIDLTSSSKEESSRLQF